MNGPATSMDWSALQARLADAVASVVAEAADASRTIRAGNAPGQDGASSLVIPVDLQVSQETGDGSFAPLAVVQRTRASRWMLWRPPGAPLTLACGEVARAEGYGVGAWSACVAHWQREQQRMRAVPTANRLGRDARVRWYGGRAFAAERRDAPWHHWPGAWFFVPTFEWRWSEDVCTLRVNVEFTPGDHPEQVVHAAVERFAQDFPDHPAGFPHRTSDSGGRGEPTPVPHAASQAEFEAMVRATTVDIAEGRYDKLVLGRVEAVQSAGGTDVASILARLAQADPAAYLYALSRDGETFLGASPERLVRVTGGVASVDCLAGTAPRGRNREDDRRLEEALLASRKNRSEHQVVLHFLRETLAGIADEIDAADTPQIRKLAHVQHLHTPVRAFLKSGVTALDVAARLHPTPAVAGRPRGAVLPVIRAREQMDRGWYAGWVGCCSDTGDGDFTVALRCALLAEDTAWLYAGAGIMADSVPADEWQETAAKMQAMREAVLADAQSLQVAGRPTRGVDV
ncbi:MAG: isochorismate synthase [Alicyclobacillus sp.]|nr:isochorismate synthase [Alicyclobacillus sp.]